MRFRRYRSRRRFGRSYRGYRPRFRGRRRMRRVIGFRR